MLYKSDILRLNFFYYQPFIRETYKGLQYALYISNERIAQQLTNYHFLSYQIMFKEPCHCICPQKLLGAGANAEDDLDLLNSGP